MKSTDHGENDMLFTFNVYDDKGHLYHFLQTVAGWLSG